jgi:hypothetical protein
MTTPQVVLSIGPIGTHERKPVVEYSDLTATVAATPPRAGRSSVEFLTGPKDPGAKLSRPGVAFD